jgi:hypothetical protein
VELSVESMQQQGGSLEYKYVDDVHQNGIPESICKWGKLAFTSPTTGKLDYYNMLQNRPVEDEVTLMTLTDNTDVANQKANGTIGCLQSVKFKPGLDKNDIDIINVDGYWVRALLNRYATIESNLYLAISNALLHPATPIGSGCR